MYISGGIAGFLSNLPVIPLDVIKTRIQKSNKPICIIKATKNLYKEGGIQTFFKGSAPILLNGTFVNIFLLPLFD